MAGGGAQIRGVVGQIKWSYYVAAALHGFTVQRDKESGRWELTGTVVTSDAFRLSQSPLEFVVPHKHGVWRWTVLSHAISQATVTATLALIKE